MIAMTLSEIARIMSGVAHGEAKIDDSAQFHFDSRQVNKGDVFLALKGENADGHDFVGDAMRRGAVISIVSKPVEGPHILVKDVINSL